MSTHMQDPPGTIPLRISIDPTLKRRLKVAAAQRDMTMRQLVEAFILAGLMREGDADAPEGESVMERSLPR